MNVHLQLFNDLSPTVLYDRLYLKNYQIYY